MDFNKSIIYHPAFCHGIPVKAVDVKMRLWLPAYELRRVHAYRFVEQVAAAAGEGWHEGRRVQLRFAAATHLAGILHYILFI